MRPDERLPGILVAPKAGGDQTTSARASATLSCAIAEMFLR
jgi:hypothetical protein